jgi:hypothetical protein
MYTIQSLADELCTTPGHVRKLIGRGYIAASDIGTGSKRHLRISESEVRRYLESRLPAKKATYSVRKYKPKYL